MIRHELPLDATAQSERERERDREKEGELEPSSAPHPSGSHVPGYFEKREKRTLLTPNARTPWCVQHCSGNEPGTLEP